MKEQKRCPFVYADGRQCGGCVSGWRLYGHRQGEPLISAKKVRIWCSVGDDHAGINRSVEAKERMEFYPDKLPTELWTQIEASL